MSISPDNRITTAELNALTQTNDIESQQDAGRNGMYKMCRTITKKRSQLGFSDADIFEGLAMGCEKTDVSFYTYTALEYVSRYTTRYGAAVVVVVGIYQVLKFAANITAPLFKLIFATIGDTSKDMYKKDKTMRDDWFTSGASQEQLANTLLHGFTFMLPPGLASVVAQFESLTTAKPKLATSVGQIGSAALNLASTGLQTIAPSNPVTTGLSLVERLLNAAGIQDQVVRDQIVRDAMVRDGAPQAIKAGNLGIAKRRI